MESYQKITGKKSLKSTYGQIQIDKSNPLRSVKCGQKISPLLREKLAYIGQLDSYEQGAQIAKKLLGVQTNDTAIYRLTDKLGEHSGAWLEEEDLRQPIEEKEVIYGQVDGSMILTREASWKEVKLGRIFGASAIYEESESRKWLKDSEYVSHLGGHKDFENKMSEVLDAYADKGENLVFINDGAKWQWNWISAEYPLATQILDFFHAMQHVGNYLTLILSAEDKSDKIAELGRLLKEQGVEELCTAIELIPIRTKTQKAEKEKLKTYLNNNRKRMDYPTYIKRGLLIGSGAIESAHRTVIQRRMKMAGQRWSISGAKNMLNLRTLNMSGYWSRVISYLKCAA